MARFFQLLAQHFPKERGRQALQPHLNWGEYVHFTSGAAGTRPQGAGHHRLRLAGRRATTELERAKSDFPGVTY